jgi:NADPH:quinone reductase-like Zn-dependent oxidoreductase
MKAWELRSFGRENLALTDKPIPQPSPTEVLVRVVADQHALVEAPSYLNDEEAASLACAGLTASGLRSSLSWRLWQDRDSCQGMTIAK